MVDDDHTMSDFEVALMDSIKTVIEVLVAKNIVKPVILDKMLQEQRRAYPEVEMAGALYVVDELRRVLNDPERARLRTLLEKPGEGTA